MRTVLSFVEEAAMQMASLVEATKRTQHAIVETIRLMRKLAKTDPKLKKRLRYYRRYERVGRARRRGRR